MLLTLLGLLIIVLSATRPVTLEVSDFELNRRRSRSEISGLDDKRLRYAPAIMASLHIKTTLLLVFFVLLATFELGLVTGIIVCVVFVLFYRGLANLKFFLRLSKKLYTYYEKFLISGLDKAPVLVKWLSKLDFGKFYSEQRAAFSKQELVNYVKNSSKVLSKSELKLVESSLKFENRLVEEVMTPRSMIDSINHDELLGPITLTDLHKTGHSRFPVIDKDIDHIVGMLYVRDLLTIDSNKNSSKASRVMDKEVCFIRQDHTLDHALAAFLKTKKLLFVVINEFRETVGLLSLEDVLEALLGQRINDEFEHHSDLRAVAARNPKKNNSTDLTLDI